MDFRPAWYESAASTVDDDNNSVRRDLQMLAGLLIAGFITVVAVVAAIVF